MHWSRVLLAGAAASFFAVLPAAAAVDAYLQIDGVAGESQTRPGWIEVSSFQWGVGRGISSPTGGASDREGSTPSVSEIVITKTVDKASPLLSKCSVAGCHYKTVVLMLRKAGGEHVEFLRYTLTNVMVSSYHLGGGGSDNPTESVTFHFAKIQTEDTPTETPPPRTVAPAQRPQRGGH